MAVFQTGLPLTALINYCKVCNRLTLHRLTIGAAYFLEQGAYFSKICVELHQVCQACILLLAN